MATVSSSPSISVSFPAARPRQREFAELLIGFVLVMLTIWSPQPWQAGLFLVATVTILFLVLRSREQGWDLALRIGGVGRSLWVVLAAVAASAVLLLVSIKLGTFHSLFGHVPAWFHVAAYTVWAFEQEFILQFYFLARLLKILPGRTAAILAAAVLFSVAHLPNPLLTVVTLAWGAIACALFLRYRSLYAIALSHAILGLAIAVSVPNHWTHHMMVGLGFYHP